MSGSSTIVLGGPATRTRSRWPSSGSCIRKTSDGGRHGNIPKGWRKDLKVAAYQSCHNKLKF